MPASSWSPVGTTRVAAVVGQPVRHSLSPAIHNAAFRALDLDWVFVAFEVDAAAAPEAIAGMRAFQLDALSVTMPHKSTFCRLVDELSDEARALQAVNCVVRGDDGALAGHNTDGAGFLRALTEETGFDPAGRSAAVVGAGGAARAVTLALARAGAREVVVVNRTPARAEQAAALAGAIGRVGSGDDLAGVDLVVDATPAGMPAGPDLAFDPAVLQAGQVVVDLVYDPAETPLLRHARDRGLTAVNGLGMLVHQAAVQFELYTGLQAPLEAMRDAVRGGRTDI